MVLQRSTLLVPLIAVLAVLAVAFSAASAHASAPANAAGGDAPPLNPSIVGVPILRTDTALGNAADAVDSGSGAAAVGPLKASRRNLIRSYRGAKFLIAHMPPPAAEEARASSRRYVRLAKRFIRASRRGGGSNWIRAQTSRMRAQASDEVAGPVFADTPTAVFNVFTSQYQAATTAAGLTADTKGNLLSRVKTSLNTAIILRNRLVKIVAAAAPPAPEEARLGAHASQEEGVTTFDMVMPGVAVLLTDELQQMQALSEDTSVPAASRAALTNAIAADNQIQTRVNTLWPPAAEEG
jgi:hypothetical protein